LNVEPFKETLSKTTNIREWFERYEFYLAVNEQEKVPDDETKAAQVTAANSKNLALFINCVDGEIESTVKGSKLLQN
jgi:hypothetical protein